MMRRKSADGSGKPLVTPSNAKRAIAVGKVLAPVLLPFAARAAATARGMWDERRARRLGVPPGELNNFSGKGGALLARISVLAQTLRELRTDGDAGVSSKLSAFRAETEPRLVDLAAAVRAAEMMPTERRRAAHRAVAQELDQIEPQLLRLLGVNSNA